MGPCTWTHIWASGRGRRAGRREGGSGESVERVGQARRVGAPRSWSWNKVISRVQIGLLCLGSPSGELIVAPQNIGFIDLKQIEAN